MPDVTGLAALDVFIGMAFLFFLLATVVAAINELIQTALNARARTLAKGIATLVEPARVDAFFGERQIRRLAKPAGRLRGLLSSLPGVADQRRPSYVPARAFALTILETATRAADRIGEDLVTEASATVDALGMTPIRAALAPVADAAEHAAREAELKLEAVARELERTYDEVMDRASGWYKRYVQVWLLGLSLLTAIGLNVDAVTVAERLWKNDALRATVVQQAQRTAAADARPTSTRSVTPAQVAAQVDAIEELDLPVGWGPANTTGSFWERLAGWLVTAAAVALGAPFWFDVLGRLARVRGTGAQETTATS